MWWGMFRTVASSSGRLAKAEPSLPRDKWSKSVAIVASSSTALEAHMAAVGQLQAPVSEINSTVDIIGTLILPTLLIRHVGCWVQIQGGEKLVPLNCLEAEGRVAIFWVKPCREKDDSPIYFIVCGFGIICAERF